MANHNFRFFFFLSGNQSRKNVEIKENRLNMAQRFLLFLLILVRMS